MSQPDNNKMEPALLPGLEPLSRRSFLRTFAVTGMVLTAAVSSGCSTLLGRREAPEKLKYKHLKPDEVATLGKLIAVYLPTDKFGLPDSLNQVPTLTNIDTMVGHMAKQTRDLLGLGLWLFEYRPMASFKFKRFSRLDTEKARVYVQSLQQGNFIERGLLTTMVSMIGLNYWRDPSTWDVLNYWGPVSITWGVARLGNAPLPTA